MKAFPRVRYQGGRGGGGWGVGYCLLPCHHTSSTIAIFSRSKKMDSSDEDLEVVYENFEYRPTPKRDKKKKISTSLQASQKTGLFPNLDSNVFDVSLTRRANPMKLFTP